MKKPKTKYREQRDAQRQTVSVVVQRLKTNDCIHRGELTRTKECPSCSGSVHVKIHGCDIYGECTLSVKDVGVQRCVNCPDRQPSILE